MATRKRRKRKQNPRSISPRLQDHAISLVEMAARLSDNAHKISSHFGNNRLGKLFQQLGEKVGDLVEEIEDELDSDGEDYVD